MSERILLALAGHSGSNKSAIAKHLNRNHGFEVAQGSRVLQSVANTEGLTLTKRHEYNAYYTDLRKTLGKTAFLDMLLATPGDRLVIDGLRNLGDAQAFRRQGGCVVGLVCPFPELYRRVSHREDPKDGYTSFEEFMEAEQREFHATLPGGETDPDGLHARTVLLNSDFFIPTEGPLDMVKKEVDELLHKYILPRQP